MSDSTSSNKLTASAVASYAQSLGEIAGESSSSGMKTRYLEARERFYALGLEASVWEDRDILTALFDAERRMLISIARLESSERGLPVLSDAEYDAKIDAAIEKRSRETHSWIAPGSPVRVTREKPTGLLVGPNAFAARQPPGTQGTLLHHIPGHGGDAWAVQHGDEVAAYWLDELAPIKKPTVSTPDVWLGG
jgi:hypothetical protein